jgi:hypothetical protein
MVSVTDSLEKRHYDKKDQCPISDAVHGGHGLATGSTHDCSTGTHWQSFSSFYHDDS